MPVRTLHALPLACFVLFPATFLLTYIWAVLLEHVEPDFPYISDAATYSPESCVFGQFINIGCVLRTISLEMSPRRDRMRGHKRDQGYYSRSENGSDNRPPPHSANEVWSEHMSSSGKKYYYNNLCGISQWDKPSDWIDPPPRRHYSSGNRERDDESDHSHRRYRDNHNYYSESSYRDQHSDMRNSRQHYNYNDVHGSHEMDTSSGGSTPVQDIRLRPNQDSQPPLTMASALPRNLSHQSSAVISHQMPAVNNYMPNDNMNRHTSLNVLLKSKMDGIQNIGTYGNFSGSEMPMLTPSLSKYVSNDLVKHVSNWPADVLERQAQKYSDESYILGNLQCMRVCSDLKCARALVRHMEIKATLQDQKLEYIRQLIDKIKDIKPKNSIMSDEP